MSRSRKETAQNTTPPDGGDKIATLAYSLWIDRGCPELLSLLWSLRAAA